MRDSEFTAVVRQHESMVYSIALHFCRNQARAEEIAQDVFLHLFRTRDTLASEAHVEAWLRRTTLHRCIDASRKRADRAEKPLSDLHEPPSPRQEPDFLAYDLIRSQVAQLPEPQRAIVILRFQEELEPTEIANLLDIPVNTVKSRLHRALAALRARFESQSRQPV